MLSGKKESQALQATSRNVGGGTASVVNGLGGSVVDEKRTSVEAYPGKWIRFLRVGSGNLHVSVAKKPDLT